MLVTAPIVSSLRAMSERNHAATWIGTIQPSEIAAMEWYAGGSEVPQKYNRTKNACAVLVIWTK